MHLNKMLAVILCALAACVAANRFSSTTFANPQSTPPKNPHDLPDGLYAEITLPPGVVVCELYYKQTPITVASFVGLAEGTLGTNKGTPFFNGLRFQRIVPYYLVQGGQGPRIGYSFPDECVPGLRHDAAGILEMANGGPDTNGSQFVIMLAPAPQLNYNHTVFGRTVRGLDLLPKITATDVMQVKILRLGDDAKAFKADQQTFDALLAKGKKHEGPLQPGPDSFLDDPDKVLGTNATRARDFNTKLSSFHRFTNVRIVARIFSKTPDDAAGDKLEPYLAALAEKLKVAQEGALVVYLQDKNQWLVRLGKDSTATFIAGPRKSDGTKDPAAASKTLDQAMSEMMAIVTKEPTPPSATQIAYPRPGGTRLGDQFDYLMDQLIFRLEPAAPKP